MCKNKLAVFGTDPAGPKTATREQHNTCKGVYMYVQYLRVCLAVTGGTDVN